MDLVKLSAAAGVAVFAALALVSTARQTHAESSLLALPVEAPELSIPARIDQAFRATEPVPVFSLSGPALPPADGAIPHRTGAAPPIRWPLSLAATSTWSPFIDEASRRFGVPADWVRGVMQVESGGRTMLDGRPITSSAGAMGLMQVMPDTFAELTARYGLGADPYDPRANILAGAAYLREMYDRYGPQHFLAAYNAGPGRVDAHLRTGQPLPAETRRYTATLLPRLVPGAVLPIVRGPAQVQDLTSPDAIGALALPPSRSVPPRRADPAHAPVFVAMNSTLLSPARHRDLQPSDGLFVTLSTADRRPNAATVAATEN